MKGTLVRKLFVLLVIIIVSSNKAYSHQSPWLLVDNFEQNSLMDWHKADTQNETNPKILKPQITEIRIEESNGYLLKKPAKDGIVGNRKALSFTQLPMPVNVGETFTFYTRILVEYFPNNHAFGLSDLSPEHIKAEGYNAFEPTLRVTDKSESNGFKNSGTLMVKIDSDNKYQQYDNIQNYDKKRSAQPLKTDTWYQIWYVVNNSAHKVGGQSYDVYLQGGEFKQQALVYKNADFRMKKELPLIYFLATTNTGSHKKPYGNGGLAYDDIYMSKGVNLTNPTEK